MHIKLKSRTFPCGAGSPGFRMFRDRPGGRNSIQVTGEREVKDYVGAIDQGTTSTRFMVFDRSGRIVSVAQKEHEQIFPQPGWVEHDPAEIWRRTQEVIEEAMKQRGLRPSDLAAVGITNQRETTIVWDRRTAQPVHNA